MPETLPKDTTDSDCLYPRLLGDSWNELAHSVRHLHGNGEVVHAKGIFRVRHGTNWLARLMVWLLRFPLPGEKVAIELTVAPSNQGEEWRRTFDGRLLASMQRAGPPGFLIERIGSIEATMRLKVLGGAMLYHSLSASFCLGLLRVPLPRWCAPALTASESPMEDQSQVHVTVEATSPLLGLLLTYEGTLTRVETTT